MAAILETSKASLSEHAFSPLTTPVPEPSEKQYLGGGANSRNGSAAAPNSSSASRRSTSSGGKNNKTCRQARNPTETNSCASGNGSSGRGGSNGTSVGLSIREDYRNYIKQAIQNCESFEEYFSPEASFDRESFHLRAHPSIDEGTSGLGENTLPSWHRQKSTRISGLLTSGNSTDRSSTYSWGDDEFDKQATKCVAAMFEEIDKVLYDSQKSQNAVLNKECTEWAREFVYMRILGSRLMDPSKTSHFNTAVVTPIPGKSYSGIRRSAGNSSEFDSANQDTSSIDLQLISQSSSEKISSDDHTPRYTSSGIESANTKSTLRKSLSNQNEFNELDLLSPTVTNTSDLSILGHAMNIQRVPSPVSIYDNYSSDTEPNSFDIYVEDIFYEDGEIEEIFAYDNQELSNENELQHKFHVPRKKKKGYPPLTPFACTRDTTFSNVLEALWPETIHSIGEYLHKRLPSISQKDSTDLGTPTRLSSDSKDLLLHQSRIGVGGAGGGHGMHVGSNSQARLSTAGSQLPDTFNPFHQYPFTNTHLNEVLSIAPKLIGRRKELGYFNDEMQSHLNSNSTANFHQPGLPTSFQRYNNYHQQQQPSGLTTTVTTNNYTSSNNSTSKTRYPSAKTRLQPISMGRSKRNSSVGSVQQTSSIITAGNTMMGNNPMVVKKLFPENPSNAADRIMTPPIILGTGGYRHNQLPPIDNIQEGEPQQVSVNTGLVGGGGGVSGGYHSKVSKTSANKNNSRVFSARMDEVSVKRAVKNYTMQKENFFVDYSRPSTTAEFRDEIPGSPLGNPKWHPHPYYHQQTTPQISPLAALLKSKHSQDNLSGLVGNGIVGVSMNLNYREDSTLSDETLPPQNLVGHNSNLAGHHPSYTSHGYHQNSTEPTSHWDHHQSNGGGSNSRPSSRHPRHPKLGTAR